MPFELGRPLGVPGDPAFQTRVLRAALGLLLAPAGPVLIDYPEEAPGEIRGADEPGWACPLALPAPDGGDLGARFEREFANLLPWYRVAVERRARSTVGLSGLSPEAVASFVRAFLEEGAPANPVAGVPLAMAFKHASADLKALYGEAVTAQPGAATPNASEIAGWFWNETQAGQLLRALREKLESSDDRGLRLVARVMLVPAAQLG